MMVVWCLDTQNVCWVKTGHTGSR